MKLNWNKVVFVALTAFAALGFSHSVVSNQVAPVQPQHITIEFIPAK